MELLIFGSLVNGYHGSLSKNGSESESRMTRHVWFFERCVDGFNSHKIHKYS